MESWLKPQLCAVADIVPTGAEWRLEGKFDGWRFVSHRDASGVVRGFAGRNGSEYSGKLAYIDVELFNALPPDSAVDGELIGSGWGDVQGVMTRGAGTHVPSKAIPALTYIVFDLTRLAGTDLRALPWSERRRLLEQIEWAGHYVQTSVAAESTQANHEKLLELGFEGSVCKRVDAPYTNTRSNSWVKIKPQATIEATITGFKPGESSFAGMIGAIEFETVDGAKSRCSGFDMRTRQALTENPDLFIGRTIEVKHHGIGATGKPRHPQFLRFRPDRDNMTPREQQVAEAVLATTEVKPTRARQVATATRKTSRRMRNYAAMGDAKLVRVIRELENQGESYQTCVDTGSGNPDADLAAARGLAAERGLL